MLKTGKGTSESESSIDWTTKIKAKERGATINYQNIERAEIQQAGAELLEVEDGLRWYAIQTKPRKETLVEKRLRDLDLEIFLPWLRARRRIGTRYEWVLVPLFPGYLFCRLDLMFSGKAVRYALGVRDFVRFGNRIPEVDMEIIEALQDRCTNGVAEVPPRIWGTGERVRIREGALAGFEAIFEREMGGGERVAVLLELLGRPTRVVLPGDIIDIV